MAIQGTLEIHERAGVKIHSFTSPADGWRVNSQVVEGPGCLVIFDAQLLNAYAEEVAAYAFSLKKPIERIVISHAHPDHWAGLEVMAKHFPSTSIHALAEVSQQIRSAGPAMLHGLGQLFGNAVASTVSVPSRELKVGYERIDGIVFEFLAYRDAESDMQLLALLPEQKTLLSLDLVFSANDHLFTPLPHFQSWLTIIKSFEALQNYNLILPGHGSATDGSGIRSTAEYLHVAQVAYGSSTSATEYAAKLKDAFPARHNAAWVEFSGKRLFAARS